MIFKVRAAIRTPQRAVYFVEAEDGRAVIPILVRHLGQLPAGRYEVKRYRARYLPIGVELLK
jgi:hypothetical protein